MADTDPSQRQVVGEAGYRNDLVTVISDHLRRTGERSVADMQWAADIVDTHYPMRDALGVCLDLNTTGSDATTVLAGMFAVGHEALPEHWRSNPEIARTVLTISGHIEIGLLRAQQTSVAHEGGMAILDERLQEVESFTAALQEK